MKPGIKITRINRSSVSCKVFVGKTYTIMAIKDGWLRLKEKKSDGYSWDPKNFIIA